MMCIYYVTIAKPQKTPQVIINIMLVNNTTVEHFLYDLEMYRISKLTYTRVWIRMRIPAREAPRMRIQYIYE